MSRLPHCVARHPRQTHALLERAARLRALALGFCYPEPGHRLHFLRQLARVREHASGRARARIERLRRAWGEASEARLPAEYARLFLGNSACPPRETAYGDARRIAGRPAELADVGGFYAAFGVAPSAAEPDLPDHVCAELEFYSLLLVKQAYAEASARRAQRSIARRAAHAFLEQHLARWIAAFARSVAEAGAPDAYRLLANAIVEEITEECRRMRARPRPHEGRLPFDEMQASELLCPRASTAAT